MAGPFKQLLDTVGIEFSLYKSGTNFTEFVREKLAFLSPDSVRILGQGTAELFLQQNYTGPQLDPQLLFIPGEGLDSLDYQQGFIAELTVDSEIPYQHVDCPHLLLISLVSFRWLNSSPSLSASVIESDKPHQNDALWLARVAMIHQSLLLNASQSLHDEVFAMMSKAGKSIAATGSAFMAAEYALELARADIEYSYDKRAKSAIDIAKAATKLKILVTGSKSVRTKFQTRQIASLVVLAKSDQGLLFERDLNSEFTFPTSLKLDSDLLLETPKFEVSEMTAVHSSDTETKENEELASENPNEPSALANIDSALLILLEQQLRSSSPSGDAIINEQLQAYISRILACPIGTVNWTIYSRALWERSVLESKSSKTVERGTLQLASLVDELGDKQAAIGGAPVSDRLKYIHVLPLLPRWHMDIQLAEQYLSLGMVKSAQEIYARLRMPIESALCTAAGGDEHKVQAEQMLREYIADAQLRSAPDLARAWSCLGDVTQRPEYWEKAWDIGKYAVAKRSLGEYCFKNSKPREAIGHLAEALTKNPLNRNAWFLYGCAGLECEEFNIAAEGFTRCVGMDREDAKAWANLSTALMHLSTAEIPKDKEALNALNEACRLNPDDWRLWSNLVVVSAKLNEWQICLRATIKIIELRSAKIGEDSLDIGILRMLAQLLVADTFAASETEVDGTNSSKRYTAFESQALTLFTVTLPKLVTRTPELWGLVAKVELWRKRPWAALEAYEKEARLSLSLYEADETSESKWTAAIDTAEMLVDAYTNLGDLKGRHGTDDDVVCRDWRYRARSWIRSVMSKGRHIWAEDSNTWDRLLRIRDDIPR
ncbi:uncharacterized protein V1516DRAFT_674949 [Lipomyces oligophaga]|uniref:uncharacterized protein n=1 Tax=Lipomyces oligophaga TaxID=45792 RepID=UPI0034CEAB0F